MATAQACDNLDDFFDFDQLEHDRCAHVPNGLREQHVGPFKCFDDGIAMDWTADEPAPLPSLEDITPHDIHVPNVFDGVRLHDLATWPMVEDPYSSLLGQVPSSLAPASSFNCYESPRLPYGDNIGVLDTFELSLAISPPESPSTPQPITAPRTDMAHAYHSAKPNAPLRQASTTSWKPASAKRKGPQSRIPLEARQILEDEFAANPYPCSWEMDIIAHQANLDVKKVRNWFNNTRARKKGDGKFSRDPDLVSSLPIQMLQTSLGDRPTALDAP
jgi:hypothetical protein